MNESEKGSVEQSLQRRPLTLSGLALVVLAVGIAVGALATDDADEIRRLQADRARLEVDRDSQLETISSLQDQVENLAFEVENIDPIEVAPASCVEALDLAQEFTSLTTEALSNVGKLFPLIQTAYITGLGDFDAEAFLKPTRRITDDFHRVSNRAFNILKRVKPLAGECRLLAE